MATMPKLSEAALLTQVKQVLTYYQLRHKLIYKRMYTGPVLRNSFKKGTGSFTKNPAVGMADLLIWVKNGPVIAAELKTYRGQLTYEQMNFRHEIQSVGHQHVVWRSVEECLATLEPLCGQFSTRLLNVVEPKL